MEKNDTVGIRRLKNEASRILDEVQERGADYVITKRGRPVAVIRPWRDEDAQEERERRARSTLARLAEVARRVGGAVEASGSSQSAASAVSKQRR